MQLFHRVCSFRECVLCFDSGARACAWKPSYMYTRSTTPMLGDLLYAMCFNVSEARVPHDPGKISSFFAEFWSLSKNGTMRHLLAYRFIEGLYTTVVLTSSLYYLTFIDGLWGSTRSTYVVVLGVVLAAVTTIMIPCWTQFYRVKRPGVNVNTVCPGVVNHEVLMTGVYRLRVPCQCQACNEALMVIYFLFLRGEGGHHFCMRQQICATAGSMCIVSEVTDKSSDVPDSG